MELLNAFAAQHPHIEYITPSSPTFNPLRQLFSHPEITPSVIIRPPSIPDVATVVSFLARTRIPFTVRAGGHDMHGRSTRNDTVVLDLRLINHVEIDKESSTARVGGGTLISKLIPALQADGYVTPVGSISHVGYVGWAMYGGYGAYSARFGLGVDQIVGARVVTADGEVVDADQDGELLRGVKGAGGAFGVVVEVTTRVYKLEKILAGVVMYKSEDLGGVIRQYNRGYRALADEGLPAALSVHQCVIPSPAPTFALLFVWASEDTQTGEKWLERIGGLAPLLASTVKPTTPQGYLDEVDSMISMTSNGRMYSISTRQITDEVGEIIAHYMKNIPSDPHIIFDAHQLRRDSPSAQPTPGSVFNAREEHYMYEITAIVQDRNNLKAALAWGGSSKRRCRRRMREFDHEKVYGGDLPFLRELKRRLDPENVFSAAISYL
ncbi:D-lactate dehydrogenase [Aspergillus karnatakaensis]|uniref:FAD-binding oxidoreductase n=1 Tax=Aspergillus karnatakaensis TaxID=1810916 RepID=UPI003CCDCF8D